MNIMEFYNTFKPKRLTKEMRLCEVPMVGKFSLLNLCEYSTLSGCGLYKKSVKHKDGWRKCLKQCHDPIYVGDFKKGIVKERLPNGEYWYHEIEIEQEY